MDCSRCGEPIDLDLLRCRACGHDMLSQDITQRPGVNDSRTARSEKPFADALVAVQQAVAVHSEHVAAGRQMRLARRLIGVVLVVIIALEWVLSLL